MTGLSWRFNHRVKSLGKALPFCLLAVTAAAFLFLGTAQAQEEPEYGYVDLIMLYEQGPSHAPSDVIYGVQNIGTATALGVTVEFELEDLEAANNDLEGLSITGKKTVGTTNQVFKWEVGTIPPGGVSRLGFSTILHSGHPSIVPHGWEGLTGVIRASASAVPPEADMLSANNVIKVYSYATAPSGATKHIRHSRMKLLLSVDDLRPPAAGDVNFGLTADLDSVADSRTSVFRNVVVDVIVTVKLSDGLEFKDGWTPPATFVKSDSQSATWSPLGVDNATTSPEIYPGSREIEIEAQLTSEALTDIPLEERCITVRVTASLPPPSADYPLDSLKQCLGDDPPVLFEEGRIAILTSFPCTADATPHQCQSTPGIAIAARVPSGSNTYNSGPAEAHLRSHGVGRRDTSRSDAFGRVFLDPESVFIQVKDPEGRVQDSNTTHRVAALSWQTARQAHAEIGGRPVEGVAITYTRKDITDATAWNSLGPRILTFSGADGGDPPGGVKIRVNSSRSAFFDLTSPGYSHTRNAFTISSVSTSVVQYFADFETLGTYFLDYSLTMTDSDSNQYTDTGRYTFHVGPVAELEVQGGGPSPAVPAGQRAYSIVAVNNGPDDAPAAQVAVNGLNAGDYVSHNASHGTFNSTTGVWTIGELITKDISQATRNLDGEVLTIITSAALDTEITANITNTQDYQVCIDSSANDVVLTTPSSMACTNEDATNTWHTTEYYDYISDNNSATIQAKEGTGEYLPVIRSVEAVGPAAIEIIWSEIKEYSGRPVTHYEVERETNPREIVADEVTVTKYVDTDMEAGENPRYRVRAVNDWDQEGPWSQPSGGRPGAPGNFRAEEPGSGQITLRWSAPQGVTVTGYNLEYSTDGGDTWTSLPDQGATATSYNHTGLTLTPGATWQYRLRAVGTANNAVFRSGWVFASAATEAVGPPQNLAAAPDPDASRNHIDLTWGEPAFGADLVTGYRIDYTPATPEQWQTLEHSYRTIPRSYQHTGREPGHEYCYRVAVIYSGGTGPFAARACATTEGAPEDLPGEPENLRIAQVGSNYVMLEWDPPSVGGPVEYYQWQSNIHQPGEVTPRTATSVSVGGLSPASTYNFQVRGGNSYGPGGWSQPIHVALNRAGSAVKATPAELEVDKGGSGSFNVRPDRSLQWPLMVYFTWEGPDCLTESLLYQQGKILLPTNPPPSKEFWDDFWWGPPEDRFAVSWNSGLAIRMDASGCQGGETAVVNYDLWSFPFSLLEGLPMWEELGLNQDEWREKWGSDPLDGASGPSVKVTVVDGGE